MSLKVFLSALPHIEHIEQVTFMDVQKFFYWGMSKRNWKRATFICHHKQLNAFFKWAVEKKLIDHNPFDDIEKPKLEESLPKSLTKHQAFTIVETAASMPYYHEFLRYRNHALFATYLYTGLRRSEALNLMCSDVDLDEKVIFVKGGKGGKDRPVPVLYRLQIILKKYRSERDKLKKTCPEFFVSLIRDQGFTHTGLRRVTERMVEVTGIEFHVHMLRHTFATMMLEGGCDIYSLSKMMGHSDIKTTTIYLSASVEHLRGQMDKHPLNYI